MKFDFRVNDGEDEIDVRVRFPEWARKNQYSMNQVMVANHAGGLVPLFLVTNYEKTPGYSMINRLDYKRVIQVTANIDTNTITSQEVNQNMQKHFAEISTKYPGYNVNYGGEEEDRNESMANLMLLFLVALMIIYLVLSSFFRSLILTSGTTVLGLFPTIYGLGGEDAFVAPLALAFGYGLIFATFITLILIPFFYHIAEDVKKILVMIPERILGVSMQPSLYEKSVEAEEFYHRNK